MGLSRADLERAGIDVAKLLGKARVAPGDEMNKTERRYADLLEARRLGGELAYWFFGAVKLKLAEKTYYTPDFMVVLASGEVEFHEVKGFWRDDARVKIKVAARMFPFTFRAVQWKGGRWVVETIAS